MQMLRFGLRYNSTGSNGSVAGAAYDGLVSSIRNDLKLSIRNKQPVVKTTLRGVISELKNLEIENNGSEIDKFKIYDHLNKLIKQRNETAKEYLKPGQPDRFKELAEAELQESKIISKYLNELEVASFEEIKSKLDELMKAENITDKRKIFSKIPWNKINAEWNASKGLVSDVINTM